MNSPVSGKHSPNFFLEHLLQRLYSVDAHAQHYG